MISNNTKVFLLFSVLLLVENLNLNSKKANSLRCRLRDEIQPQPQPQPQPIPTPIPNVIPTPEPIHATGLLPPPKEEQKPQPQPAPAQEGFGNVRYVLLRSNPDTYEGILQFTSVLVRNEKMEDIAKGKKATYSPPWPGTDPSKVLTGREYSTHQHDIYTTSARGDGFFKIDLGVPSFVKQVEIWNRDVTWFRQIGNTVTLLDENNKEIIKSDPLIDAGLKTIVDFKRRYVPKQFSPTQKVNGQCTGAATVSGVRYVKVLSREDYNRNQFSFSQLAVYNNNNVNVALKKPCKQSSSRSNSQRGYDCSTALDGKMNPRGFPEHFCAGNDYKEWFLLDLQSVQEVSKIIIVNTSRGGPGSWVFDSMTHMRVQLLDENTDILKEYLIEKAVQEACITPN